MYLLIKDAVSICFVTRDDLPSNCVLPDSSLTVVQFHVTLQRKHRMGIWGSPQQTWGIVIVVVHYFSNSLLALLRSELFTDRLV